jgi:hypothetical protein
MTDDQGDENATAAAATTTTAAAVVRSRKRRWTVRGLKILGVVVVVWLAAAYLILPFLWKHYEHQPGMENAPKTTMTAQGIPGDPLNVGLIGDEKEIVDAMAEAGWDPADPVTLRTSLAIASSVIRNRPYLDAPVSPLFVFGRKQDLAFEKPVGDSARHRHHVRFWKSTELGKDGMPFWIGAVTFDRSVGLSHRTGQITHHIAPDVDAERDGLIADLRQAGRLRVLYQVTGVGATLLGRNGGGDLYYTDGELTVGVLAADFATAAPEELDNPPIIDLKEQLWSALKPLLDSGAGSRPVEAP